MKKTLQYMRNIILTLAIASFSVVSLSFLSPTPALADACDDKGKILTLKPWYNGLAKEGNCAIKSPGSDPAEVSKFAWTIGLNIAEDIMQLAGYVAVGLVIYGGFIFMTSTGSPDRAAAGRKTLINALVGLAIAIFSVAIVNLIARTALGIK